MTQVPLYQLARARAGDKGDTLTVAVVARAADDYPLLVEQVTTERVVERMHGRVSGAVRRYCLPKLSALLFVCEDTLAGGITSSTVLDGHGKSLGPWLLGIPIELPGSEGEE